MTIRNRRRYITSFDDRSQNVVFHIHIGWSDVTEICGHNTISMLWSNTAYCVKLSGENLSRYSNKTESVSLRKCPYYHYLY